MIFHASLILIPMIIAWVIMLPSFIATIYGLCEVEEEALVWGLVGMAVSGYFGGMLTAIFNTYLAGGMLTW